MAICPATSAGCIDDICYGSGCLKMDGEEMLEKCSGCGGMIGIRGGSREECECEPDDSWEEDDRGD